MITSVFILDLVLPVPASTLRGEVQSSEGQLYWERKIGSWEERGKENVFQTPVSTASGSQGTQWPALALS